ncbi:hypothetical protein F4775DRAFT_257683 [Biscogniauxia sp. FL1348]|nr:hypothetical protein F4775DRAFT_257683 [Biscogniauxia sp. FL1348]
MLHPLFSEFCVRYHQPRVPRMVMRFLLFPAEPVDTALCIRFQPHLSATLCITMLSGLLRSISSRFWPVSHVLDSIPPNRFLLPSFSPSWESQWKSQGYSWLLYANLGDPHRPSRGAISSSNVVSQCFKVLAFASEGVPSLVLFLHLLPLRSSSCYNLPAISSAGALVEKI